MPRFVAIAAVVLLVTCGAAPAQVAVGAWGFRWWRDAALQQQLALTPHQVTLLDRTFGETFEQRRQLRLASESADRDVAEALLRGDLSEEDALSLVTRAEALRARRNVTRTIMLLRLYRILTPAQRQALERVRPRPGR